MFPPYNSTLVMRKEAADAAGPDLAKTVDLIQTQLTDEAMQELNARVDLDKQHRAAVAQGVPAADRPGRLVQPAASFSITRRQSRAASATVP